MSNPTLRFFLATLGLFFISNQNFAQSLEVNPTIPGVFSPEDLLTQVFVNQGIDVENVTFEGAASAVGEFKSGFNQVNIEEGILLSTGSATAAVGVGSNFASSSNGSVNLSNNLQSLTNNLLNDGVRYIIEFQASSDSIRFQYVFASEEYPEFSCSIFNDIFGLFISGPGIAGPFENGGENIALIPGTSLPVSIANINPGENFGDCPPQFVDMYNDNNDSANQPVYDGYLDVFFAVAQVIPGETYTLEIAIADAGDSSFDSAVFLAAETFGSDSLVVNTDINIVSSMAETGGTVDIPFDFTGTKAPLFPITYQISGTAEYGVDYQSSLPETGTLNSVADLLNWSITPTIDGIAEQFEYIKMRFDAPAVAFDEFVIYLSDTEVSCDLPTAVQLCEAAPVVLSIGESDLDATFSFENNTSLPIDLTNAPFYSSIEVSGVPFEKLYNLDIIESVCLNIDHNWLSDMDVYLLAPDGSYLELTTDNGADCDNYTNTCFSPTATETLQSLVPIDCNSNGLADNTGYFQPEGNWRRLLDTPVNGIWQLVVIDDAQGFSGTLTDWSISFSTAALREFPVLWSTGQNSTTISVFPTETTTYEVSAGPNCSGTITVEVLTDYTDLAFSVCENETVVIDGTTLDANNPTAAFTYANQAGCDSIVSVEVEFLAHSFTELEITIDEGEVYDFNGNLLSMTGTFEQVFTAENGCDSTVTLNLTVFEPPFILLENDVVNTTSCDFIEYCLPLSVADLNALESIQLNGFLYAANIESCQNTPVEMGAILLPVGENEVILTDQNGYADTTVVTVTPAVQTLPTVEAEELIAPFEYDLSNVPICGNSIVSINNLCPDMSGELFYTETADALIFDGGDIANPAGTFCMEFCDNMGFCFLQNFEIDFLIVHTSNLISEDVFQLFPSPTNDVFYLKTTTTTPIDKVELFGLNGQILKSWAAPKLSESFDIQEFSSGVYYLKIATGEGIVVKKVVRQ